MVRCDRPRQRRHRGLAVAKIGDRWAAHRASAPGYAARLRSLCKGRRQGPGTAERLGAAVCGRRVSHELAWLGITHTPSFVGEPQCNGGIERFIRTLKEQCLWPHRFETLAEARAIIAAFTRRYNEE